MSRTFTVTHPDGTTSKRTAASRVYPYAIVREPRTIEALLGYLTATAEGYERDVEALTSAMADPQVETRYRWSGPRRENNHYDYDATLLNTGDQHVSNYCNAEGEYRDPDGTSGDITSRLIEHADSTRQERADDAARLRKRIAGLVDGTIEHPDAYEVVRWSSRRDLAEKALAEFAPSVGRGHTLAIVETVEAVKKPRAPKAAKA